VVASFVHDIPFFALSNPILKGAFANWQANGIITVKTGMPFNVSTGTDTANTAVSGTYRPNLVHAPTSNCGRGHLTGCNLLFGPGSQTANVSVFKNFSIKERLRFQFRFETFALFNRTNFGNPDATIN